jgi:hypothetical protein
MGTGFLVMAIVTGALAAGTVVVGSLALANKGAFDDALAADDLAEAEDLRETGVILNGTTDALLVSTVVAAGVATVLLFTGGDDGSEARAGWQLAPTLVPGHAGLVLEGAF